MLDYNYSVCEIVFAHSTIILWLYLFQILEFWIGDDQSMFQVLFKFFCFEGSYAVGMNSSL